MKPGCEMADKTKALCKWSKRKYTKDLVSLREIVNEPRFYCKDCGRVAHDKKWLCKPAKL
jgi:hypothetical protein